MCDACRFEHCLGTAHLAKELALRLYLDDHGLEVDDADFEALELAGNLLTPRL